MCKVCSNICADYYFVHPLEYEQTITKIQDLIEQKQLILVKGNCDIDKYQDENGCWADDVIYHVLRCPECGQLFHCSVDTYHGKGSFVRDKVIADEKQYNFLWDTIFDKFLFKPQYADWKNQEWLVLPTTNYTYRFTSPLCWNDKQEKLVNSFFESLIQDEMYALDWQHDCFVFSPKEHISSGLQYYDYLRDCNVYFPSYYPDGDYYFFVDKNWKYGLFGHPWKREIKVMGQKLIDLFEANSNELAIEKIQIQ